MIAHETGFVFEVEHPAGQPAGSTFANIAAEYCRRFQQEAVLHVRTPAEQWLYQEVGASPKPPEGVYLTPVGAGPLRPRILFH